MPIGGGTPPGPSRRRWPPLLLAVAASWLIGWAYLVIGGRTVTAEVVEPLGDGTCDVTWTSLGGQSRNADVDCADDAAGTIRKVWELAPPFTGEAVDPAWTIGAVLGLALLAALPAGAGMLSDRRDRRRPVDDTPAAQVSSQPSRDGLPPLTEADLIRTRDAPPVVLARYAPYAHRQVPPDGWEQPGRPGGARIPSLRRDLARVLLWPALGLGIALMLTAPSPWRWWQLTTTGTAHATAVSTGKIAVDGPAFVPQEVTVTYRDSTGATRRADVATTRELPEGVQVRIVYSVAEPGWARVEGEGDGLPRSLLLTGAGALIALGIAGVRTWRLAIARRKVSHAAGQPGRPALATLTGAPRRRARASAVRPGRTARRGGRRRAAGAPATRRGSRLPGRPPSAGPFARGRERRRGRRRGRPRHRRGACAGRSGMDAGQRGAAHADRPGGGVSRRRPQRHDLRGGVSSWW